MADGDFRDPWGRGPQFSKRDLLENAVKFGAVYTAKVSDAEVPYDGARFHADKLESEGMFRRVSSALIDVEDESIRELALWIPTKLGNETVKAKR